MKHLNDNYKALKDGLRKVNRSDVFDFLRPETELERALLSTPEFLEGLDWGKARYGHPEGKVFFHVREVLNNIERLHIAANEREVLRLVALSHDTFKYMESAYPPPRERHQHHAYFAYQFMKHYIDDQLTLNIIAHHDEAYYVWRGLELEKGKEEISRKRLAELLRIMGEDLQLYYYFFKCDTQTGDKNQASLRWFEKEISGIEVVKL